MNDNQKNTTPVSRLNDADLEQVSGGDAAQDISTFMLMQNLSSAILANFDLKGLENKKRYKNVEKTRLSWVNANDSNKYQKYADSFNKQNGTSWMTAYDAELIFSLDSDAMRAAFAMDSDTLRKTLQSATGG